MTPFYSVIVPVYNNEADLEKCISSILTQSCKDFELILVDDGSTDRSPQICDRFADQDDRIIVLHLEENGGAAAARNTGLAHASGKYVYHVDGDDWIAKELLEHAKQVLDKKDPPDMFVFCQVIIKENGKYETRKLKVKEGFYYKEQLEKEIYPGMICKLGRTIQDGTVSGALWDKVIKKELLERHYCKDTALFWGEDRVCAWECLFYADTAYFSPLAMYYYNRCSMSSGQKRYHTDLDENYKAIVKYLRFHLKAAENTQIERQITALEFRGVIKVIQQEIRFHHSIRSAADFLKAKYKGQRIVSSLKALPLSVYPCVFFLNLHCFTFLLICVGLMMKFNAVRNILNGYLRDRKA